KLSSTWWEFDIGWMYIRFMAMARLAWVKKVAPTPVIGPIKPTADMDTLRAVLTNRFRVMSCYYKDVLLPVFRVELHRAHASSRQLLKRARKLLAREESLLDDESKRKLANVLNASEQLKIVYNHKQRLQALWKRSSIRQENLLHALQEWCTQAEAAGIGVLEEFARSLRGYTLKLA
nr:acyl-CoA desaturase [Burkholderiales bacterium]